MSNAPFVLWSELIDKWFWVIVVINANEIIKLWSKCPFILYIIFMSLFNFPHWNLKKKNELTDGKLINNKLLNELLPFS